MRICFIADARSPQFRRQLRPDRIVQLEILRELLGPNADEEGDALHEKLRVGN